MRKRMYKDVVTSWTFSTGLHFNPLAPNDINTYVVPHS